MTTQIVCTLVLAAVTGSALAQPLPEPAWRADLTQMETEFMARDRAYTPATRRLAEQRIAGLQARQGTIDATRFALELAQIVALADNGHSLAYAGPRASMANRVGLRLAPFGRSFHVVRAREQEADLLGARLMAIDGVPIARLRDIAHRLTGGVASWRDRQAPLFLESPAQLHALGLTREPAAARYTFVGRDGARIERRLEAEPPLPGLRVR